MPQKELGSVARFNARPPGIQTVAGGFDPLVRQNILKWIFVIKIIYTAILSLPLIQVGQLSIAGKVFVNLLGLSLYRKSVVTLNDLLDIP